MTIEAIRDDSMESLLEDSVSLYLRRIDETPLLTAEQEIILARQLKNGKLAGERLQSTEQVFDLCLLVD